MRPFDWHTLLKLVTLAALGSVAFQLWRTSQPSTRVLIHRRLAHNASSLPQGESQEAEVEIRTDVKRILYWTTFNGREDFAFGYGTEPFSNCEYTKCEATSDRSLLEFSDALVFNLNNIKPQDLPRMRAVTQHWVLVNGESPFHSRKIDVDGLFNLTMSYKSDSDIVLAHGKVIPLSEMDRITFARSYSRYNWAQGKTKLVAWFVSHCGTPSKREQFVKELKKFIPVDVYGSCGPLSCGKGNYECDTILAKYYKFYLSFENSMCKDYVTEKLWSPLMKGVVPVVMGYANYKTLLPNNSYIDVKDFKYIRQMAQHLQALDQDDDLYNQHFEWRKTARVANMRFRDGFCELCKYLHTSQGVRQTVDDFSLWNSEQLNCQTPSEYFSTMIDRRAWLDDAIKEARLREQERANMTAANNHTQSLMVSP